MRGVFITFEGVEGSGKSTQAKLLARNLERRGIGCILSREPGGTGIGESIRSVLLDPDNSSMDARTELFLYLASRNQHVREKVLPALREGRVVVLDRYAESSVAYQGGGRELGEKLVSRLNKFATAALKPDMTFLVDVPVAIGRRRKRTAELDRLEQERVEFHERVRNSYLRMARRAPKRIRLLDGTKPEEELEAEVRNMVDELLLKKGIGRR
ncbi:MAG: dTMP kinase [candidate division WOR-3 bacterium]|nr:MAG: dTMP kinase [candidate division WOR-3 bacterium]